MIDMITFQAKQFPSIIKVLGVGGGGSNAVNHMFKQGITGVDFAVCNTDVQALESSPVPIKIEIGNKNGLGAGAKLMMLPKCYLLQQVWVVELVLGQLL